MEGMAQAEAVNTVYRQEFELARATASTRLRVLGQELEQKGITDFAVVVERDGYHVRGQVPPPSRIDRFKRKLGGLFGFKTSAVEPDPYLDPYVEAGEWARRYSESDLARLDDTYKARRTKTGMPDDYAVSQVLRVVGAYVEARGWVLIGINRTCDLIEITHHDAGDQVRTSVQTYAALYDFALHMSNERSNTS